MAHHRAGQISGYQLPGKEMVLNYDIVNEAVDQAILTRRVSADRGPEGAIFLRITLQPTVTA